MKSNAVLARESRFEKLLPFVANDDAQKIASSWAGITAGENALAAMGYGHKPWRAAPPVQNAMAAMVADMLSVQTQVICVGFQGYGWQMASGNKLELVMCGYLGKTSVKNITSCTTDDVMAQFEKKKSSPLIVAIHSESAVDWNCVRAISAAAVKSETPLLVLVSAAVPAPEGAAIEVFSDWTDAAPAIRDAAEQVLKQGAIRVVAMEDMDASGMERAMIDASAMAPEAWSEMLNTSNDNAERAANAAYRAPVDYI
jgi:hypothetical protein